MWLLARCMVSGVIGPAVGWVGRVGRRSWGSRNPLERRSGLSPFTIESNPAFPQPEAARGERSRYQSGLTTMGLLARCLASVRTGLAVGWVGRVGRRSWGSRNPLERRIAPILLRDQADLPGARSGAQRAQPLP